jgi:hypothetical protein
MDTDGEQLEYDQSGGGQRGEDGAIPVSQGRMSPVAARISTLPMNPYLSQAAKARTPAAAVTIW